MYFPYLRGKQFELLMIRDNVKLLVENNIHPIIEPVKEDFTALIRAMKIINEHKLNCTLIINPQVGQSSSSSILKELIDDSFKDYKNISIGYILKPQSNEEELIKLLKKYKKISFTLVHYGYTNGKQLSNTINSYDNIKIHAFIDGFAGKLYQRQFKKNGIKRVLIRNGFKTQTKNSLYPPNEHFSDLHITFPDEGMNGFGDYLIAGVDYSEKGGPAYAVAIHLTYLDSDDDMFIYHFISDQTDSPTDPGGKFLEALSKLVKEVEKSQSTIFESNALTEYLKLAKKQHYPGLGFVKKLSMQHHIELIANYMKKAIIE